jgi:bifunctional non-homologous end joining protein LigD
VADSLGSYKEKRDFEKTPEPRAKRGKRAGQARFVVQEHSARRLHWDLRLEHEGTLAS